jgi:hypothetical protein
MILVIKKNNMLINLLSKFYLKIPLQEARISELNNKDKMTIF